MRRSVLKVLVACVAALTASGPAHAFHTPLRAWGANQHGQLGVGDTTDRPAPTPVAFFEGKQVSALAAGDHTLALTGDGKLWSWGANGQGELGLGDTTQRTSPVQVTTLDGYTVIGIAAGYHHSLALTSGATVWAWGRNSNGQLGLGDSSNRSVPTVVASLEGRNVSALVGGAYHSVAVTADGKLWTWGNNSYGQLGLGYTSSGVNVPTEVTAFAGMTVTHAAAGYYHTLARTSDGKLWAWGRNEYGQLGLGDTSHRSTPTEVAALAGLDVARIAAGCHHTLVTTTDGRLWAFGWNYYGQLGLGDTDNRLTPTQVSALAAKTPSAVAAGFGHSIVHANDRTTWAWGVNFNGQLGLGDTDQRTTPVALAALSSAAITVLAAGDGHCLACLKGNTPPTADAQSVDAAACVPKAITLTGADADGDPLTFEIETQPAHGNLTGTPPNVTYTSTPGFAGDDSFTFKVNDGNADSAAATVTITVDKAPTTLYAVDRAATITEPVVLRAYLRRATDSAWLDGKTIAYQIDGTDVGSAVTGATGTPGRADLTWTITDGPALRTVTVAFAGDAAYKPSGGSASVTCQSWTTKMVTFNRTGRITDRTELKARLLRSDNAAIYGKSIGFSVDGTFIIARSTNVDGYASYPNYDIPNGAGAGVRTVTCEWAGNGGYAAITRTATLTVQKAIPYVWVLRKSVAHGGIANLYAYFRRLYDYQKQEGKPVAFKVDGTWVADVTTGTGADAGVARHLVPTTGLSIGTHTIRCEFAGDAWLDAGYGEADLVII